MKNRILPWLRLCRLPTVFTALADIVAGYCMSHAAKVPQLDLLWLLLACAGLYLAGMVFNDVFDVQQDLQERPGRPIPSGAISKRAATVFGWGLIAVGLGCARAASAQSLAIALILTGCILAYDALMKRTAAGPVFMGACRFFNILLGASSAGVRLANVWQMPQIWLAAAMGIYIVGVTWFARTEAKRSHRAGLVGAWATINGGLMLLAVWILDLPVRLVAPLPPGGVDDAWSVMLLWGVIVLTINRRLIAAIADPVPGKVQPAIATMLLSIIGIDAMMIYFKLGSAGVLFAVGTICLLFPAILLRKWIPMT